eukprot:m.1590165 g.1590165  ORF g.1590165 m.1590165 type:complete len:1269 (+) comp25335_c0_seq17:274-4080(+)
MEEPHSDDNCVKSNVEAQQEEAAPAHPSNPRSPHDVEDSSRHDRLLHVDNDMSAKGPAACTSDDTSRPASETYVEDSSSDDTDQGGDTHGITFTAESNTPRKRTTRRMHVNRLRRRSNQQALVFADIPLRQRNYFCKRLTSNADSLHRDNRYKYAMSGCLSTGEPIDFVLVAHLPRDAKFLYDLDRLKDMDVEDIEEVYGLSQKELIMARQRFNYENRLVKKRGLKLERVLGEDEFTCYTLIHAPKSCLLRKADRLGWPLQLSTKHVQDIRRGFFTRRNDDPQQISLSSDARDFINRITHGMLKAGSQWLPMARDVIPSENLDHSTYFSPYSARKHEKFAVAEETRGENEDFAQSDRSLLVWDILLRTKFQSREWYKRQKIGIEDLLLHGNYAAAFPLHDGQLIDPNASDGARQRRTCCGRGTSREVTPSRRSVGMRARLMDTWASRSKLLNSQPLLDVKNYFGTTRALYFLFLGHYTVSLVIPATLGLIGLLYGLATFKGFAGEGRRTDVEEFCTSNFTMCGLCNVCEEWQMPDWCTAYEAAYVLDNEYTIFFAIAVGIWSSIFLDTWKRVLAVYKFEWHLDPRLESNRVRAQFAGNKERLNAITGKRETYMTLGERIRRHAVSISVSLCMILVVLIAVVGTISYRVALTAMLSDDKGYDSVTASTVATATAAVLNLIVILTLNAVYEKIAIVLTDFENHRTIANHKNYLIVKVFAFQFVNTNAALMYIALVKPLYNELYGYAPAEDDAKRVVERCPAYGCKLELAINLIVLMVGSQWVQNLVESYMPLLKHWWEQMNRHRATARERKQDRQRRASRVRRSAPLYQDGARGASTPPHRTTGVWLNDGDLVGESYTDDQPTEENDDVEALTRNELPWEEDYRTLAKEEALSNFDDFQELAIQFGFCTMYTSALPITPLIAFFNNAFEIRLDARKMLVVYQRGKPFFATNIGVWLSIFQFISFLGVLTTGLVMAVTSDWIPKLVFRDQFGTLDGYIANTTVPFTKADNSTCYFRTFWDDTDSQRGELSWHIWAARVLYLLVFEHVVYLIKIVVVRVIPDIPAATRRKIALHDHVSRVVIHDESTDDDDGSDAGDLEDDQTMLSTQLQSEALEPTPFVDRVAGVVQAALFWRKATGRRERAAQRRRDADAWGDLCAAGNHAPSASAATTPPPRPSGIAVMEEQVHADDPPAMPTASVSHTAPCGPAPDDENFADSVPHREEHIADSAAGRAPTGNMTTVVPSLRDSAYDGSSQARTLRLGGSTHHQVTIV